MSGFDPLPSWPAGHRVTGAEAAQIMALLSATGTNGGLWSEMVFFKASDQLYSAQTTLQNDVDIIVPCVANATYAFFGAFIMTTNATAFFKCQFSVPSGAAGTWSTGAYGPLVTSSPGAVDLGLTNLTTSRVIGTNAGTLTFQPKGNIVMGSTAGNVVFQHAQSVSNGSGGATTGMRTGSFLVVKRVS